MSTSLRDRITKGPDMSGKSEDDLYWLVESGFNTRFALAELKARGLPKRRKSSRVATVNRGWSANRGVRVTGGAVDPVGFTRISRPHLPGQRLDPWYRH